MAPPPSRSAHLPPRRAVAATPRLQRQLLRVGSMRRCSTRRNLQRRHLVGGASRRPRHVALPRRPRAQVSGWRTLAAPSCTVLIKHTSLPGELFRLVGCAKYKCQALRLGADRSFCLLLAVLTLTLIQPHPALWLQAACQPSQRMRPWRQQQHPPWAKQSPRVRPSQAPPPPPPAALAAAAAAGPAPAPPLRRQRGRLAAARRPLSVLGVRPGAARALQWLWSRRHWRATARTRHGAPHGSRQCEAGLHEAVCATAAQTVLNRVGWGARGRVGGKGGGGL
jgi:hypothetical protein